MQTARSEIGHFPECHLLTGINLNHFDKHYRAKLTEKVEWINKIIEMSNKVIPSSFDRNAMSPEQINKLSNKMGRFLQGRVDQLDTAVSGLGQLLENAIKAVAVDPATAQVIRKAVSDYQRTLDEHIAHVVGVNDILDRLRSDLEKKRETVLGDLGNLNVAPNHQQVEAIGQFSLNGLGYLSDAIRRDHGLFRNRGHFEELLTEIARRDHRSLR